MATTGGTRPNVVLVHTHDLGRHLGCYGADVETPHIDALAADGALFENYNCTAPQCSPSRASIMSGRYPHEVGMLGLAHVGWELDDDVDILPDYLSAAGYDTHLFGVQHLARADGVAPEDLGYDVVHRDTMWCEGVAPLTGKVTPAVTEFLRDHDSEDPFLATVGFFEPHRLGRVDDWDFEPSTRDRDDRWDFEGTEYRSPSAADVDPLPWLPDRPEIREDQAAFHGMIRAVDDAVGRITAALERADALDDTLVLFTTDHGSPFPRAKGTCYDPGLGTALIANGPGVAPGTHDALLSNVDLLPTVLDYLENPAPADLSGRSFAPLLRGDAQEGREKAYAEMTYHLRYCPMRAIRTDRYKYVRNFGESPSVYMPIDVRHGKSGVSMIREYYNEAAPSEELYDLRSDPGERNNLIDSDDHADARTRLSDDLDAWMERTGDPLLEGVPDAPEGQRELFWSAFW